MSTVVIICACDCCAIELLPGQAQADGYCPFCADCCFPVATLPDGDYTRVVFDRVSRERLHVEYDEYSQLEPIDPVQPDPVQAILENAAEALGKAAKPHLKRMGKQALKKIFG